MDVMPNRTTLEDLAFLKRKIKAAKEFQKQFSKHIEKMEALLELTKRSNETRSTARRSSPNNSLPAACGRRQLMTRN